MKTLVRIGTRRSKLSLWQANCIAELIVCHHPSARVEIREFTTRGDANPTAPLPAIGGKGVFTEALEAALRNGEIDCAAHSLKDLPVDDAAGLAIGAIPKRADARDALVSRTASSLAELPPGARIGTGSLRRRAQLLALRPDLAVVPIRGNVPTRVSLLDDAERQLDAIVLAAAGLNRLGMVAHIRETFTPEQMLSAAGQGALALQCRADPAWLAFFAKLNDAATELAVSAERAFLGGLEGGCSLPVGAYACFSQGRLRLHGRVIALDGSRQLDLRSEATMSMKRENLAAARKLGADLAVQALEQGAGQMLTDLASSSEPDDS
ncbi:MAG: hydroxymethylbilane synthase [Chloroflexi bacterium]|nr:hydroxymethylbilane synthase [Chloroflexota bacterium]